MEISWLILGVLLSSRLFKEKPKKRMAALLAAILFLGFSLN
ncbi:MAG: hypothetical protein RLZZ139_4251, partial [Cyanobacteriota bacterium]